MRVRAAPAAFVTVVGAVLVAPSTAVAQSRTGRSAAIETGGVAVGDEVTLTIALEVTRGGTSAGTNQSRLSALGSRRSGGSKR